MTSAQPLDIKVIYRGSGRRTSVARVGPMVRVSSASRRLAALGTANFLIGMVYLGITWWPVDHFIYQKFVYKTPVDVAALGPMFGLTPEQIREGPPEEPSASPAAQPTITGRTAQVVIGAAGYGWLALSSIACCVLTFSAGAAWGQWGSPTWRMAGRLLFFGVLLGLVVAGILDWSKYQTRYPTDHLRLAMLVVGAACFLLGLSRGHGALGWSRIAGGLQILAALSSVVGLYLGALCGAIPPEQSSWLFLGIVFAVHSGYGWIVWPLASRWAK